MKKFFKSFVFAVAGLLTVAALASCDNTPQHEHAWEVYKDATHHWQECACGETQEKVEHSYSTEWSLDTTYHYHVCECGAKDEKIPHNFGEWVVTLEPTVEAEGSRKQTCTDCGREKVEAIEKLKPEGAGTTEPTAVYAVAPSDWAICNIYFWTDGADSFVSWPGVEMTLVDETTNLWGYVLPEGVENVIFDNGSQQTIDIPYQKDGNLYTVIPGATEKFEFTLDTYVPKDTDPELNGYTPKDPTVAEDYTIYVQVDASWGTPNIYFWEGKKADFDWPGVAMTEVDAANGIYSYVIDTDVKTVIFNNGTVQTVNLTMPTGADAYVINATAEENGQYGATPMKYNNGKFEALPEDYTIYVQVDPSWGIPNIYFWEGQKAGFGWPGVPMTEVDAATGVYSFVIDTAVTTVIFNNGTVQTVNLTIPAGANAYVLNATAEDNGQYDAQPKNYADGVFNDIEVQKVTPEFYLKGTMNNWSDNDAYKLVIDGDTSSLVNVEIAQDAEFKVATSNWAPEFGWGKFVDETNGMLADNNGNIKVVVGGTFSFVVTNLNETPVLTITGEPAEPAVKVWSVAEIAAITTLDATQEIVVKGIVIGVGSNATKPEVYLKDELTNDIIAIEGVPNSNNATNPELGIFEKGDLVQFNAIITQRGTLDGATISSLKDENLQYSDMSTNGGRFYLQYNDVKKDEEGNIDASALILSKGNSIELDKAQALVISSQAELQAFLSDSNRNNAYYTFVKLEGPVYFINYIGSSSTYANMYYRFYFDSAISKLAEQKVGNDSPVFRASYAYQNTGKYFGDYLGYTEENFASMPKDNYSEPSVINGSVYCIFGGGNNYYHQFILLSADHIEEKEEVVTPSNKFVSAQFLPLESEVGEYAESLTWNEIFLLDSTTSGKAWKISSNNKKVLDLEGNKVQSSYRLQSAGNNTMVIDLTKYSGEVTVEFFVLTASNDDLTRTITVLDGETVVGTFTCDLTSDDAKAGTCQTQIFSVVLTCGKTYVLNTSNGINFHGINVKAN